MNTENMILVEAHTVTAFENRTFYKPVELFLYHNLRHPSSSVYAYLVCYGRNAVFRGEGHAEGPGYGKHCAAAANALKASGVVIPDLDDPKTSAEILEGVARALGFSNLKTYVLTAGNQTHNTTQMEEFESGNRRLGQPVATVWDVFLRYFSAAR